MPPEPLPEAKADAWANAIRSLHHAENRGALADLRRMEPDKSLPSAFWIIAAKSEPAANENRLRRMARVLQMLAFPFRPDGLDSGRRKLGAALEAAGVSEARVQKLMTARGPALDDQVIRIARRLANSGALPYRELAELLLAENHDSPAVETIRLEIARGYWATRNKAPADIPSSED